MCLRHFAIIIFAAEQPSRERRVGQQVDILKGADFGEVVVEMAAEEIVLVLDGRHPRQAVSLGNLEIFGRAPARFVGEADGANLTGLDLGIEGFEHLSHVVPYGTRVLAIGIEGP